MKTRCKSHAYSRCGTLENPHCSVAMNAKHGSKIAEIKQRADN